MKIQTFKEEKSSVSCDDIFLALISSYPHYRDLNLLISETLKVKNLSKKSCYKVKTLREVYGTEYKNMIDVDTLPTDQHVRHEYEEYVSSQR